jgi:hypothetical protein
MLLGTTKRPVREWSAGREALRLWASGAGLLPSAIEIGLVTPTAFGGWEATVSRLRHPSDGAATETATAGRNDAAHAHLEGPAGL